MSTPNTYLLTPHSLLQSIRLPFWFACFLAVIGVAWRTPLASVMLLSIFLVLLVAFEWASRRLLSRKTPLQKTSKSEPVDEHVQQQMVRTKTAEGLERLDGTFCVEFPTDALTATVHIPFCPVFEKVPKIQVFPVDESGASLRIISPKVFGVRVDVKRNDLETRRFCFAVVAEG